MTQVDELAQRPTISVEEAAVLLGVSRGTAYEAARRYVETEGAAGIPAIRVGLRRIVVPTRALLALLEHGRT